MTKKMSGAEVVRTIKGSLDYSNLELDTEVIVRNVEINLRTGLVAPVKNTEGLLLKMRRLKLYLKFEKGKLTLSLMNGPFEWFAVSAMKKDVTVIDKDNIVILKLDAKTDVRFCF